MKIVWFGMFFSLFTVSVLAIWGFNNVGVEGMASPKRIANKVTAYAALPAAAFFYFCLAGILPRGAKTSLFIKAAGVLLVIPLGLAVTVSWFGIMMAQGLLGLVFVWLPFSAVLASVFAVVLSDMHKPVSEIEVT